MKIETYKKNKEKKKKSDGSWHIILYRNFSLTNVMKMAVVTSYSWRIIQAKHSTSGLRHYRQSPSLQIGQNDIMVTTASQAMKNDYWVLAATDLMLPKWLANVNDWLTSVAKQWLVRSKRKVDSQTAHALYIRSSASNPEIVSLFCYFKTATSSMLSG